jgi:hypothetical protein
VHPFIQNPWIDPAEPFQEAVSKQIASNPFMLQMEGENGIEVRTDSIISGGAL